MNINNRIEPEELRILRYLRNRMTFSEKDEHNYFTLEKGYQGELQFDLMLQNINEGHIVVINGLLFEHNNTLCQIDSVLIAGDNIYLINVKNFERDYVIKEGKWYTLAGKEVTNPLGQLNRSDTLFSSLLKDLGFVYTVEPFLVFVNPLFYLYQAPTTLPAIFPPQINRFLKKINSISKKSKAITRNIKLAEQLVSLIVKENPYKRTPIYRYETLQKKLNCVSCHSIVHECGKKSLRCSSCGHVESVEAAVLRCVDELMTLFPEMKISTGLVYDWCGGTIPKKTIRRVLNKYYNLIGTLRYAYYDTSNTKIEQEISYDKL